MVQIIFTFLTTLTATSSGFWIYLRRRSMAKDATTKLLMGLAHDKITFIGMKYIERGYVTKDEYADLVTYFYEPYRELGGNGTAALIIHAVENLPLSARGPIERATESVSDHAGSPNLLRNEGQHE